MDIAERLNKVRQSLLDLSTRNRLVSLPKEGKAARVIHVHDEISSEIYRLLVTEQKSLQFAQGGAALMGARSAETLSAVSSDVVACAPSNEGKSSGDSADAADLPQPDDPTGERHRDLKLQTRLTSDGLQKRLLQMYYDARTLLEEQGVNVLYLALGQLRWLENSGSEKPRFAPLILVPVALERRAAGARFTIQWDKEDLAENLSLAAKIKADFGLVLPSFEFSEEFNPELYFDQIDAAVAALPGFKVERNGIALAFFSFAKFLMYRDLDASAWPKERAIDAHPKIMGLMRDGFPRSAPPLPDEAQLDQLVPPSSRIHVVDADGSQSLVVAEVERGTDLVVQGPPGTGKSQTITNLIASAVYQGKTVLFVAEKLAALEVVKRNLARIGLDQIALELHSNKAHKRAVLDDLARTLSLVAPPPRLRDQAQTLSALTSALNDHVGALHETIGNSETSAFGVIGALARLAASQRDYAQVRITDIEGWQPEARYAAHRALIDLAERLTTIASPDLHPWRGVCLTAVLPAEGQALAQQALARLRPLAEVQASAAKLAEMLRQPAPKSFQITGELCRLGLELGKLPEIDRASLAASVWSGGLEQLRQIIAQGKRLQELRKALAGVTRADALDRDWEADKQSFLERGQSLWRWFNGGYRDCMRRLGLALTGATPKNFADRRALFDQLDEARKLKLATEQSAAIAESAFGELWKGIDSAWDALEAQVRWVDGYRALGMACAKLELASDLKDCANLGALAKQLEEASLDQLAAFDTLKDALKLDIKAAFAVESVLEVRFATLIDRLQSWSVSGAQLIHWVNFHNVSERIRASALLPFHDKIVQGGLVAADCKDAFDQAYFQSLLRVAVQRHPELARFEGRNQAQLVERFRSVDREQLQWTRYAVGSRHLAQVPRANTGVGALGIVHREINRKRGNAPIRKLLASAGSVIQQTKPLFMMSPLSVAQFLQPGAVEFDLLIIDEASQVEPVDALGAVARCKQIVVVGDDKQLPPTRFFSRMTGNDDDADDEEEESAASTVESILGLCSSMGVPGKMLRWHYRSRHHSLIAVSNQEFYEKLYIVPSPENLAGKLGLKFHKVAGIYDRGKTRQNPIEAQQIARAVITFAERESGKTLGVAAFSEAQKQAVLDALEIERRKRPDLEAFFASNRLEPFFVKNLENVQGDERDVILISIGYARDASGYMAMAFGPLTNKGGERRLNVLISRARQRCEVFSSITADDIDTNRTQSVGARVLKLYLKFAETGRLDVAANSSSKVDSDFELAVKARLESANHTVHAHVGTAGFFIDLAVVDPRQPGRYAIGIECDGAAYHAARSARDRDRLRQAVLEDHGWRIHRLWSADWLHRPAETLREALAAIDAAIAQSDERDDGAENALFAGREQMPESAQLPLSPTTTLTAFEAVADPDGSSASAATFNIATPYIEARFTVPSQTPIYALDASKLAKIVAKIVDIEQPIHEDEIAQRIRSLWGLSRTGARISDAIARALADAERSGTIRREDASFLIATRSATEIRDRSNVESKTLRTPQMLPPSEIRLAVKKLIEISHGVAADEVAPVVCRWFGFQKASAGFAALVSLHVHVSEEQLKQRLEDFAPKRSAKL
jgi:very-short-patch-repair endonuclease